ncbi:MAG TPA: LLM class flavin-dependent oxidoreductase [Acidimicrobiia bacterium]|jgi:alkanesulfonate monooxygenase SsuD/methylene tetrahydromethanopterin reductase-like flavin-dependent oxidoreductase (luciferase family)
MEFGLFVQGYNPGFRREGNPDAEHQVFLDEIAAVQAADEAGFKYVWLTEHHFLDEYSHLSANDVLSGYLAHATTRIHIGAGIFNPLPQVNHPVKVAERVAMLDHLSEGRFEFGTGRGAGSHEILGFLHREGVTDTSQTKEIWEDVIAEFPKMWLQDTYEGYEGKYWSLPPRKILPKPYVKPHPPMWYAAGNTTSYEMAARRGLGVLGFSVGTIDELAPVLEAYKRAIPNADPIGAFVNDNVMVTSAAYVAEDAEEALRSFVDSRPMYLSSNVYRYHDTFPHPPEIPSWPELIPDPDLETARLALGAPGMVLGTPDDALKACRDWEAAGADQLVFGIGPAPLEETLRTIRLMGEHVIPKIDRDPVHRTTRFREAAAASGG